ncbi:MAG: O-antigen ligase family protein [Ktedonobacteraceae bacterium]
MRNSEVPKMSGQNITQHLPENAAQNKAIIEDVNDTQKDEFRQSDPPPISTSRFLTGFTPFWHDRIIEVALVLSIAFYYVVGNTNLGSGRLFELNPLISLPFLLIFAALCWYRLPFAIALTPLSLPYYLQQKTVISHYSFSITELALMTCLVVAVSQFLLHRANWSYYLSWRDLRDRLGPFALPIAIFVLAAGVSVMVAVSHRIALRAFREEVFEPILYVFLAMFCLRTRQDVARLLLAMLLSGMVVALIGMAQYFLFRNQLVLELDGIRRVHAMYGSANSIGLFFDYVLPIGLALLLVRAWTTTNLWKSKWVLLGTTVICLSMVLVLYLSQSRGAWVAIGVAFVFILALSIRNRKGLLASCLIGIFIFGAIVLVFHRPILNFFIAGHQDINGISTVSKRLILWLSALRMIRDHFWFGVGMENWLCYYSPNTVCANPAIVHYYWILQSPFTGASTGLQGEATLSHPHNILLHVWVSMGLFGLLAFLAVLTLFFWLFGRILIFLHKKGTGRDATLWWMTIGVGAGMFAGVIQGQVDSSFLAQDLSFCFWMLVTALLLIRAITNIPWRGSLYQKQISNSEGRA